MPEGTRSKVSHQLIVTAGDDFKLVDKVTKESKAIDLLKEGYIQSFIDFFYLTTKRTPSVITPSPKLLEEYNLNKRHKDELTFNEETLMNLSQDLINAEQYLRENHIVKCLKQYDQVVVVFRNLNDFETCSYFYNRQLEVSRE